MSPAALFLFYPAYGHVTPNLALMTELVRRGWQVRAVVSAGFVATVEKTGATTVEFDPPLPDLPSLTGVTLEEWAEMTKDLFLDVIKVTPAIDRLVREQPPDVLAFDTAMWAPGRVVSSRWGIPAVTLCPTEVAQEPFTPRSMRVGEPDEAAERERLTGFGDALVSLFAEHGLPGLAPTSFAARPDERNIVFVTREFQQDNPDVEFDDGRYAFVGPCLDTAADHPDAWQPPPDGKPVLLLTLGTVSNDRLTLFTQCIEAFTNSAWHVVVTLGSKLDPDQLGPLPSNVEVHRWLRHPEVLRHASACVTQTGMGSVMEALAFGVPTVGLPSHPEAIANAERLTELGLGTWFAAGEATGAAVRAAVDELAGDEQVAARLAAMRRAVRRAGGAAAAADVIEAAIQAKREGRP